MNNYYFLRFHEHLSMLLIKFPSQLTIRADSIYELLGAAYELSFMYKVIFKESWKNRCRKN